MAIVAFFVCCAPLTAEAKFLKTSKVGGHEVAELEYHNYERDFEEYVGTQSLNLFMVYSRGTENRRISENFRSELEVDFQNQKDCSATEQK